MERKYQITFQFLKVSLCNAKQKLRKHNSVREIKYSINLFLEMAYLK